MLETLIAVSLICVIFFGVMQISQMYAAREILHHAAARGARAKTVGFNHWMVRKAILIAAIPNSGDMITPDFENVDQALVSAISASKTGSGNIIDPWNQVLSGELQPSANQHTIEAARIPEFMWSDNFNRAQHVLNYEGWEDGRVHYSCSSYAIGADGSVAPSVFAEVNVWQDYTNFLSLPVTYYTGESVKLTAVSTIENHYPLYLDDKLW